MKHGIPSLSLALSFALAATVTVRAQSPSVATVKLIATYDYNSTVSLTYANSISNTGVIAGSYATATDGDSSGYTRTPRGKLSKPIVYAVHGQTFSTSVLGINSSGQLCGFYHQGGIHGFFLNGRTFTTYDVPGSDETYIYGQNDSGDFVGLYSTLSTGQIDVGFIDIGGVMTQIAIPPQQTGGRATGINNAGEVCGYYLQEGFNYYKGFYRDAAGNYTTLLIYPGANDTQLIGINDSETMVGTYTDASTSHNHGLVLTLPNVYTSFDVPGAINTWASGINNQGRICGSYETADLHVHAFVAQLR